jgi:hypothetical protein
MMLTEPFKPAFAFQEWLIYQMRLPLQSNVFAHSNLEVSIRGTKESSPDFLISSHVKYLIFINFYFIEKELDLFLAPQWQRRTALLLVILPVH